MSELSKREYRDYWAQIAKERQGTMSGRISTQQPNIANIPKSAPGWKSPFADEMEMCTWCPMCELMIRKKSLGSSETK